MKYALVGISENWRHEEVQYWDSYEDAYNHGYIDSPHDWTEEDIIEIQDDSTAEPISNIYIENDDKVIFASYWGAIEHKKDGNKILHCSGYFDLDGNIDTYHDGNPFPLKDSKALDLNFVVTEKGDLIKHNFENSKNEIEKGIIEEFLNSYLDEIIIHLLTASIWCGNDNDKREFERKIMLIGVKWLI